MLLEEIKAAIKELSPEDRRKLGVYILELEKDHFNDKVLPQIQEDLEGVSKAVQDAVERIKRRMRDSGPGNQAG